MLQREELISHIRFALEQLRVQNRHHEFERICFHLARARIASNLLPATGPVSNGGDQGRDAESFISLYKADGLSTSLYERHVSDRTVALICTTQQKNVEKKIKNDIDSLMKRNPHPAIVAAFFTGEMSVSKRHKIEDWAQETYGCTVQIWDAQAISTHLADWDTVWISRDLLRISPALIAPILPDFDACGVAAHAAVPLHPDITKEITFRPDRSVEIQLGVRDGAKKLQFSLSVNSMDVQERVNRTSKYGETVRLLRNESVQEFLLDADPRLSGIFNPEAMSHQEIVIHGHIGPEEPARIRSEGVISVDIPYVTTQRRGTSRIAFESPHLPFSLLLDFLGARNGELHVVFQPSTVGVLWNGIQLLLAAASGQAVSLDYLARKGHADLQQVLAPLAQKLREDEAFSPTFLRTIEMLSVVEHYSGIILPSDIDSDPTDMVFLEALHEYFTKGRAIIKGEYRCSGVATITHKLGKNDIMYARGQDVKLPLGGIEVPLGSARILLRSPVIEVEGKCVRTIHEGDHYVARSSKPEFILQRD